jgi:glycosyltransferase involved in cell wall biosynthesis
MPKISVVLPVHGEGKYLEEAVESVLSQTMQDIELVLVNDRASRLASVRLRSFEKKDTRVKLIHAGNPGVSSALNAGVRAASA